MNKYIDANKLIAKIERQNVDKKVIEPLIRIITSLQQEPVECGEEDEMTRKELIKLLKILPEGIAENYTAVSLKDFVAYLEKQKEQQPAEWSEEDTLKLKGIINYLSFSNSPEGFERWINFLKSLPERFNLPPKQKLNDEDEHRFELLIAMCEDEQDKSSPISTNYREMQETKDWLKNRFKSLHSKHILKPSKEQIEALMYATGEGGTYNKEALKSLLNDLKKRM